MVKWKKIIVIFNRIILCLYYIDNAFIIDCQSIAAVKQFILLLQAVHIIQHLVFDFLFGVVIKDMGAAKDVQITSCLH